MISKLRNTRARGSGALSGWLLLASLACAAWPLAAHACPMCFSGNGKNDGAFVWASLFMMLVPTTAIGALVYWAYRRIRTLEAQPPEPPPHPTLQPAGEAKLRVVR